MQLTLVASVLALASSALAITVTQPPNNGTWDISKDNTVKWTSVSTDPKTVAVVLVQLGVSPPVTTTLGKNTTVGPDSFAVTSSSLCKLNITDGEAYQINLENDQGGIVAQSERFAITGASALKSECSSATTSASTSPSATSAGPATSSTGAASAVEVAVGMGVVVFGAAFALL